MSSENKKDIPRFFANETVLSQAAKELAFSKAASANTLSQVLKEMESQQSAHETALSRLTRDLNLFKPPELSAMRSVQVAIDAMSSSVATAGLRAIQQHLATIPTSLDIAAKITQQFSNIHPSLLISTLGFHSDLSRINAQMLAVTSAYSRFQPFLQSVALSPALIATQHLSETARSIERWARIGRDPASLLSSIVMTESQVVAHEADIVEYVDGVDFGFVDDETTGLDPFGIASQNLYQVQRAELIYIARKNPDFLEDEAVISDLPSLKYFNKARSVCSLVTLINKQCHIAGRDDMFKLTNRFVEALVALPNVVATNQRVFGEFVDCLYFVIYEGAGKDKLRFSDLVSDPESEAVWELKHFRNYYCRHDVEHGKEKEIRKKEVRLGEIFQDLIDVVLPRNRNDFETAQYRFLIRVEEFLLSISSKLDAVVQGNPKGGARDE